MTFADEIEHLAAREESYFRAHLLREDVSRLRRLTALTAGCRDVDAFVKAGTTLGWTQGDLRTWELKPTLTAFLEAYFAAAGPNETPQQRARLHATWHAFDIDRMNKLVGCLSRVPLSERD